MNASAMSWTAVHVLTERTMESMAGHLKSVSLQPSRRSLSAIQDSTRYGLSESSSTKHMPLESMTWNVWVQRVASPQDEFSGPPAGTVLDTVTAVEPEGSASAWNLISMPPTTSVDSLRTMKSWSKAVPERLGIQPHVRAIHTPPEPNHGLRTTRLVMSLDLA